MTTITFSPGQVTRTVTVTVAGDLLDEIDESFTLNLSNAVNATISDPLGLGTIADNDQPPTLSVNDVVVTEGNTGTVAAIFAVTLNTPSGRPVTVDYATANNTATAPADFAAASGGLNFAAGQVTKQVTVLVNGDALDEVNETYFLNLANASNATITDGSGLGTITDDDPAPTLSIGNRAVTEGDSGTVDATFTVTLSAVSGRTVTVDYATANGSATSPADYTAVAQTALTFNPGQTSRTLTVSVNGDLLDEPNETFDVNLSGAVGATIADGTGVGTITDDDPQPELSINDVTVTEGNTGTTTATFIVSLSSPSGRTVSVQFATANGTAVALADYAPATGTVTFTPGSRRGQSPSRSWATRPTRSPRTTSSTFRTRRTRRLRTHRESARSSTTTVSRSCSSATSRSPKARAGR